MDFIIKNIDNAYEHITNSLLVYLYNYVRTYYDENNEDQLLEGKIEAYKGYQYMVDYIRDKFPNLFIMISRNEYLQFEDDIARSYIANTFGDGLGVIQSDIEDITCYYINKNQIKLPEGTRKFNELKYFTSVTKLTGDGHSLADPCDLFKNCRATLEEVDLRNITELNQYNFSNCTNLKKVINTDNLTKIDIQNFENCTSLETIQFNNLSNLGNNNFKGCTALKTALIDGTLKTISSSLFSGCTSLKTVRGYTNVTTIGSYAFYNCANLTTLDIPYSNITQVGNYAFQNCLALDWDDPNMDFSNVTFFDHHAFYKSGIKNIVFTNKPFTLNSYAFEFTNLQSVIIPNNITSTLDHFYGAFKDCAQMTTASLPTNQNNFTLGTSMFKNCVSLTTVNGMDKCKEIDSGAFWGCTSLVSLDISNVDTIGESTFYTCTSLKNIDASNLVTIGRYGFKESGIETIDLSSCTTLDLSAFSGCSYLYKIENTDNITTANGYAFLQVGKNSENDMTHIYMPKLTIVKEHLFDGSAIKTIQFRDLTQIEQWAFSDCKQLTSITGLDNVVSFSGSLQFRYCTSLTSISLASCTTMGGDTFYECQSLETVSIPLVTTLTNRQFYNCKNLLSVDFRSVTSISGNVFDNSNMVSVDLRSCKTITTSIFNSKTKLTTINVSSLETPSESLFKNCTSLVSIDLPKIIKISSYMFKDDTALTTVNISSDCTEVGYAGFENCSLLTTFNTSYLQTIGGNAFHNCTSLTTIDISNVTSMGTAAFDNCTLLTGDIILNASIITLPDYLFRGCRNLTSLTILSEVMVPRGNNSVADDASFPIYVPDDLVDAYKTANSWGNGNLRSRITPLSQKPS